MTHDAHRHNIQHFVAGVGNRSTKFNRKEEKQMMIKILAEIGVPDGKYCIPEGGSTCDYYGSLLRRCSVFKRSLEHAYDDRVPVKCDECASAGVVLGAKWTGPSLLDKEPDRPKFKVGDRVNYKSGIGEHDHGTVVTITESVTGPLLYGVRTDNDNTVWSCHDTEIESIPSTCTLDGDCNG